MDTSPNAIPGRIDFMPDKPANVMQPDPTVWVDDHGDYLFRYAMFRLAHAQAAEDLVQETFLAALHNRQTFAGRSSERTWLVGILKNKIIDHLRRRETEEKTGSGPPLEDVLDDFFDAKGRWRVKPIRCADNPVDALEQKEFWDTIQRCLGKLPERSKAAFSLRELDGLPSEEIQEVLGVTAGNLWTLLHRARISLCRCLDLNWFKVIPEDRK
jgi:RNA polymerase sigma-70 factor (ECF subfamily)